MRLFVLLCLLVSHVRLATIMGLVISTPCTKLDVCSRVNYLVDVRQNTLPSFPFTSFKQMADLIKTEGVYVNPNAYARL